LLGHSTYHVVPHGNCQAGALELESAELRFETSADGRDAEVARKQELPMMRTVAEAMIGANAAVAERIGGAFPAAALLRRHPPPRAEAFAEARIMA
jgi:DIS3-like exonuclease 1